MLSHSEVCCGQQAIPTPHKPKKKFLRSRTDHFSPAAFTAFCKLLHCAALYCTSLHCGLGWGCIYLTGIGNPSIAPLHHLDPSTLDISIGRPRHFISLQLELLSCIIITSFSSDQTCIRISVFVPVDFNAKIRL